MTDLNVPLLRKVLEHVEEQAERGEEESDWRQVTWFTASVEAVQRARRRGEAQIDPDDPWCRTTGCFAGHALLMSGYSPAIDVGFESVGISRFLGGPPGFEVALDGREAICYSLPAAYAPNGDIVNVQPEAERLLGITEDDAEVLFHAGNTVADLRRICEEIAGESL